MKALHILLGFLLLASVAAEARAGLIPHINGGKYSPIHKKDAERFLHNDLGPVVSGLALAPFAVPAIAGGVVVGFALRPMLRQIQGMGDEFIDRVAAQTNATGAALLKRLNDVANNQFVNAQGLLHGTVREIDGIVRRRVNDLDQLSSERVDQVGTGLRRTTIEAAASAVRVAFAVCGCAFGIALLLISFRTWTSQIPRGFVRASAQFFGVLLVSVALVGFYFFGLGWLLIESEKSSEIQKLAAERNAFERSYASSMIGGAYIQARRSAAHLLSLAPENSEFAAEYEKAKLFEDVFNGMKLPFSSEEATEVVSRVDRIRALMRAKAEGPANTSSDDPDLLTLVALLTWETGRSRVAEVEAVNFASHALEAAKSGELFLLKNLASNIVRVYCTMPVPVPPALEPGDHPSPQTALETMQCSPVEKATGIAATEPTFDTIGGEPLRQMSAYAVRATDLLASTNAHYVANLQALFECFAQADIAKGDCSNPMSARAIAQTVRDGLKTSVISPWEDTFAEIVTSGHYDTDVVLRFASLDDTVYTRAQQYVALLDQKLKAPNVALTTADRIPATLKADDLLFTWSSDPKDAKPLSMGLKADVKPSDPSDATSRCGSDFRSGTVHSIHARWHPCYGSLLGEDPFQTRIAAYESLLLGRIEAGQADIHDFELAYFDIVKFGQRQKFTLPDANATKFRFRDAFTLSSRLGLVVPSGSGAPAECGATGNVSLACALHYQYAKALSAEVGSDAEMWAIATKFRPLTVL